MLAAARKSPEDGTSGEVRTSFTHLPEMTRIGVAERVSGSASEPRPCRVEPDVDHQVTGETRPVQGSNLDPTSDPIYDLGWQLYGIVREIGWDDRDSLDSPGTEADPSMRPSEVAAWFSRVQGYLRQIGDHEDRLLAYQRILFVAFGAELCQRVMVDHIEEFDRLGRKLIRRLRDDHPIIFDRIAEWVVRLAADWWLLAREGIYHIPRSDGTVFVKGGDAGPDATVLRLDALPLHRPPCCIACNKREHKIIQ